MTQRGDEVFPDGVPFGPEIHSLDQWQAFLRTKEQLERKAGLKPDDGAAAQKPAVKPAWTALRRG